MYIISHTVGSCTQSELLQGKSFPTYVPMWSISKPLCSLSQSFSQYGEKAWSWYLYYDVDATKVSCIMMQNQPNKRDMSHLHSLLVLHSKLSLSHFLFYCTVIVAQPACHLWWALNKHQILCLPGEYAMSVSLSLSRQLQCWILLAVVVIDTTISITANSLLHRVIQTNQHGKSSDNLESLLHRTCSSAWPHSQAPTQPSIACSTESFSALQATKSWIRALDKAS